MGINHSLLLGPGALLNYRILKRCFIIIFWWTAMARSQALAWLVPKLWILPNPRKNSCGFGSSSVMGFVPEVKQAIFYFNHRPWQAVYGFCCLTMLLWLRPWSVLLLVTADKKCIWKSSDDQFTGAFPHHTYWYWTDYIWSNLCFQQPWYKATWGQK